VTPPVPAPPVPEDGLYLTAPAPWVPELRLYLYRWYGESLTPTLVDIIAQIIAARNYVSYYQNHIWIIASYYETLCIIAQLL
jgi:hypothetical protein